MGRLLAKWDDVIGTYFANDFHRAVHVGLLGIADIPESIADPQHRIFPHAFCAMPHQRVIGKCIAYYSELPLMMIPEMKSPSVFMSPSANSGYPEMRSNQNGYDYTWSQGWLD